MLFAAETILYNFTLLIGLNYNKLDNLYYCLKLHVSETSTVINARAAKLKKTD